MENNSTNHSARQLLGMECGGTRSVAILADVKGKLIERGEFAGSNMRLLTDTQLVDRFRLFASRFNKPNAIGIGMAGVREEEDRRRVQRAAAYVWPGVPCMVANDLEIALAAVPTPDGNIAARVLIVSGTGSCCYGRNHTGATASVGGWGHVLGDQGSGYDIGLRALKAVLAHYDRTGMWPRLGQCLLRAVQLNSPNSLVDWVQGATKAEVAFLAVDVFKAHAVGDAIAREVVSTALAELTDDAIACAERLTKHPRFVQFIVTGSVLLRQPQLCRSLARRLRQNWGQTEVCQLKREAAWGAIELAKQALTGNNGQEKRQAMQQMVKTYRKGYLANSFRFARLPIPKSVRSSPTEERNPASLNLDRLSIEEAVELMLQADQRIPMALRASSQPIVRAIRIITQAFKRGGRLFYVGAGTSGRLGALDASECPPTFGVSADLVQAIMAGGQSAFWNSMEDMEDDGVAGAETMQFRGVTAKDVVVGIAASGQTPFVWGALAAAKQSGARTILVCFNPHLKISPAMRPHVVIAPNLGPEVLTGSTRLRSGTATKMVLNMFTTLAMVQINKVVSNLMVDLNPTNSKLRDRAVRIVRELTRVGEAEGRKVLESCDWRVKAALARLDGRASIKNNVV
ncbi:MAG: N-acetylmuramic acid 6-phosphate etherase [Limisphaerales bacterium]